MLDSLLMVENPVFSQAPFVITDVVQNGMAGTACVISYNTSTAQMPHDPTVSVLRIFEFSTDGGATWPVTVSDYAVINLNGVSQALTFTAGTYSTGIKVRMKWAHGYTGYAAFSVYSNTFSPTWDYFPPATSFPTSSFQFITGFRYLRIDSTPPVLNVPNKRFEYKLVDPYSVIYDQTISGWPAAGDYATNNNDQGFSIQGFKCF